MMNGKLIIKQAGQHTCIICNHLIDWELELRTLHGTDMERLGVLPSDLKTEPNKGVFFNTYGKDKVEVTISCPRCSYQHKSEPMPLIKV